MSTASHVRVKYVNKQKHYISRDATNRFTVFKIPVIMDGTATAISSY